MEKKIDTEQQNQEKSSRKIITSLREIWFGSRVESLDQWTNQRVPGSLVARVYPAKTPTPQPTSILPAWIKIAGCCMDSINQRHGKLLQRNAQAQKEVAI
jgi:hypothetical protein